MCIVKRRKRNIKREKKYFVKNTAIFSIFIFLCVLSIHFFIENEDGIYWWDHRGYYDLYNIYCPHMFTNWSVFRHFFKGIYKADYSPLILFPMNVGHIVLGSSRFAFITSIFICWFVPVVVMVRWVLRSLLSSDDASSLWVCSALALCFPAFWIPILRGYPDIAGCVPLAAALLLLFKSRFMMKGSIKLSMAFGFCLWLMFALRRWYVFSVISVAFTAFGCALYLIVKQKKWKHINACMKAYGVSAITTGFLLLSCQFGLIKKILRTSYATTYQAYQLPLYEQLTSIIFPKVGPVYYLLFIAGILCGLYRRNIYVIFLTLVFWLTIFLFSRVQAPSEQHMLPVYFCLFLVSVYAVHVFSSKVTSKVRLLVWCTLISYEIASCAYIFSPPAHARLWPVGKIFPTWENFPIKLGNKKAYQTLVQDLKHDLGEEGEFVVFPVNMLMNADLLLGIEPSLRSRLIVASGIDQRDYFDLSVLKADFVIVMSPLIRKENMTGLMKDDLAERGSLEKKQVSQIPNDAIIEGAGMGKAYQRVGRGYAIEPGYKVYIYKRVRPVTMAEVEWLEMMLRKKYANWMIQGSFIRPNVK